MITVSSRKIKKKALNYYQIQKTSISGFVSLPLMRLIPLRRDKLLKERCSLLCTTAIPLMYFFPHQFL